MEFLLKIYHRLFEIRIEVINLILLFLIAFSFGMMIKHKLIRAISSVVFSSLISLQLVSLYFVGTFIGYQFYVHFNVRDISEMTDIYLIQIGLLLLIAFSLFLIFYKSKPINDYLSRTINKRIPKTRNLRSRNLKRGFLLIIFLGSLYFMNIEKGLIYSGVDLYSMLDIEEKDLSTSLSDLGITNYVYPNELEVAKGKNVIILSLESFERGYLKGDFKELTPNLNRLKEEWSYMDMKQNDGSDWTSGSLYTNLSGLPAYFGVHGNSIFQKAFHTNITGITHVFKKLGYDMKYITSSNAQFSGTEDLLNTFEINSIIDQSERGEEFRDKDLFEEAKKTLKTYNKNKEQFALFLSTFDTHFPNGIYDERMEEYVEKRDDQLEFMISAVDHMVGDLVEFLKEEEFLSNTVIYIFPDHLKMGNTYKLREQGERSLYLITNAGKEELKKTDNLYQLDLPDLILNGAKIEHNAKFLSRYINESDKNQFIADHIEEITSLNNAGVQRLRAEEYQKKVISPKYQEYKKDTSRFIAHAGGKIGDFTYTNSLEALNKSYNNGFRLFELDIILTKENEIVAAHDWEYWAKITGFKGELPATRAEFLNHPIHKLYTPLELKAINDWFEKHPDAILVTDKINQPKLFSELFIDKNRLMMELFSWEAILEAKELGIRSVIVSENVIGNLGSSALEKLLEQNLDHVAVSKFYVEEHKDQILSFKENNIKVYVFNINFGQNLGEDYYVKYQLDPVYGIYSDTWSFKRD